MAKYPEPGRVKTRLAATVGDEAAAGVFSAMLTRLLSDLLGDLLSDLLSARQPGAEIESPENMPSFSADGVVLTPELSIAAMRRWLADRDLSIPVATQGEGSLGDRMQFVFRTRLVGPTDRFVLIGSDLPDIGPAEIQRAFSSLDGHDVVLGPADDGGYWLIGLNGPWQDDWRTLFDGIAWSTESVFSQTVSGCQQLGLRVGRLDTRSDIDDMETLDAYLTQTNDHRFASKIRQIIDQTSSRGSQTQSSSPSSRPTVIVGGGVIGLSLAWQLAERGEAVTLIDSGLVGSGATGAAVGILPPARMDTATDAMEQMRGYSHELFDQWSEDLTSRTGIDIGYRRCGGWYLAETAGEAAAMMAVASDWSEAGIDVEQVSAEEFLRREPIWDSTNPTQIRAAWWAPDERQISPRRYADALRSAAVNAGVVIRENTAAGSIRPLGDGDGGVIIQLSGEPITDGQVRDGQTSDNQMSDAEDLIAARVVVCGGAMAGRIAKPFGLEHSIVPIRGQILSLRWPDDQVDPSPKIYNVGNRYVVIREHGETLVGSCEEEAGFDRSVVPSTIESLNRFANDRFPSLCRATTIDSWSGLRPMTFDGLAMIGRVPGQDNVYFAGGHYRSGIHLSPGTAIALADHIMGHPPAIDLSSFAVKPGPGSPT